MQVTRQNEKKGIRRRSKKKKQRKLEKMDKKKRKENTKRKSPNLGNTNKEEKEWVLQYRSTRVRKREKAGNRDKERSCVGVFLLVLAVRRVGDVYEGGTFEISI